ncbi:hypothetical protein EMO89_00395 [Bifidobacterium tissieri]|uniref:Uncharacterized protein n=1 Tax=Bifidobacterium tissieri TaxID=1630162 RepID=A0A5M9ZXN2_9BIFI|nr:hypothetical protein [Bifidobacterium tissieri]KAA8832023.1 hypothetical protein EMO89_00395 [Bifidobacterium tissieri]
MSDSMNNEYDRIDEAISAAIDVDELMGIEEETLKSMHRVLVDLDPGTPTAGVLFGLMDEAHEADASLPVVAEQWGDYIAVDSDWVGWFVHSYRLLGLHHYDECVYWKYAARTLGAAYRWPRDLDRLVEDIATSYHDWYLTLKLEAEGVSADDEDTDDGDDADDASAPDVTGKEK